jgi:Skp family chaperone for outer membrane proteins
VASLANAIEMERVMLLGFQQNILKSLGKMIEKEFDRHENKLAKMQAAFEDYEHKVSESIPERGDKEERKKTI